jgi:hypothetical protein
MSLHKHVRAHFTRSGRPKRGFSTAREARAEIGGRRGYSAYKCGWPGCGRYHIGRG